MRVLGVDPGASLGWALLDVTRGSVTRLASGTISARGPASSWRADLLAVLRGQAAELVAVEVNPGVAHVGSTKRGSGMAMALSVARCLGEAAAVAARVDEMALGLGLATASDSAETWRRALVGSAHASDPQIALWAKSIRDWPARSNAHERDAAGVAVLCGRRLLLGLS